MTVAQETTFDPREFSDLIWTLIHRWYKGDLRRTERSAHLDLEDLHQEGLLGIWERRDEFEDITDRDERGMKAMKVAGSAISKMLTANKFFRADKKVNLHLLPIVNGQALGFDEGDLTTLDLVKEPVEDHAPSSALLASFAQLKPRSKYVITRLRLGFSFEEIGPMLGVTGQSAKDDLHRDLNRHGLLAEWENSHEVPMYAKRLLQSGSYGGPPRGWHEERECSTHGLTTFYIRVNSRGHGTKANCLACEAERKLARKAKDSRVCEWCEQTYFRGYTESRPDFAKRRYCSRECSAESLKLVNRPDDGRPRCDCHGEPMLRRYEKPDSWRCAVAHREQKRKGREQKRKVNTSKSDSATDKERDEDAE